MSFCGMFMTLTHHYNTAIYSSNIKEEEENETRQFNTHAMNSTFINIKHDVEWRL